MTTELSIYVVHVFGSAHLQEVGAEIGFHFLLLNIIEVLNFKDISNSYN
jgi:hypothetical protein